MCKNKNFLCKEFHSGFYYLSLEKVIYKMKSLKSNMLNVFILLKIQMTDVYKLLYFVLLLKETGKLNYLITNIIFQKTF